MAASTGNSSQNPAPKNTKLILAIGLLVFAALMVMACSIFYLYRDKSNDILEHKGFTMGTIISYYHEHKSSGYLFEYSYAIKGMKYTGEQKVPPGVMKDSLMGKTFPLIYDTTSTHSSFYPFAAYLLITRNDFKKFNMSYPDTLKRFAR